MVIVFKCDINYTTEISHFYLFHSAYCKANVHLYGKCNVPRSSMHACVYVYGNRITRRHLLCWALFGGKLRQIFEYFVFLHSINRSTLLYHSRGAYMRRTVHFTLFRQIKKIPNNNKKKLIAKKIINFMHNDLLHVYAKHFKDTCY